MIYSKTNSNNFKGLELNTGTSIRKVNNWNFGDISVNLDEKTIACIKRKLEKRDLVRLQKKVLEQTKRAINIGLYESSYIEDNKPKRK